MSSNEAMDNQTICRLLNLHLNDFFNDIYIPFDHFQHGNWKISKILYDNEDCIFYKEKYVPPEDRQRFYEVFDKFNNMIEKILDPNTKLCSFLKKLTNMNESKWKYNGTQSYLRRIIRKSQYQTISPLHIIETYCEISKKYAKEDDPLVKEAKIKEEHSALLDDIIKKTTREIRIFIRKYNSIVESYVFENPIQPIETKDNIYVLGFINSVILAIFDFIDKLLDLNIFAVHTIVTDLIDYYLPLDDIYTYNPDTYDHRKLFIV